MTWATAELPGIGGNYKEIPADFEVEEIPLYPCSGTGEHLYLWIEKTGISTNELITRLARGLRLTDRDIGYAGLKDSRALTRQWLSVPAAKQDQLSGLALGNVRILESRRHANKLRQGHLAGNRFTIRVRDTSVNPVPRTEAILDRLRQCGVPNLFGEQRYGVLGNSARLGILLLRNDYEEFCRELMGDPDKISHPGWQKAAQAYRQQDLSNTLKLLPDSMRVELRLVRDLLQGKTHRDAVFNLPKQRLRFFLSAAQSDFFDQLLRARINRLGELKPGDIACKHANGACFRVESAVTEQPRADSFEISPTAPLFGYKVMLADGETGTAENSLLTRANLTLESWKLDHGLAMPGERRPLRVALEQPKVLTATETCITLKFSLPKGSYATSVLRELMKTSTEPT